MYELRVSGEPLLEFVIKIEGKRIKTTFPPNFCFQHEESSLDFFLLLEKSSTFCYQVRVRCHRENQQ